MAFLIAQGAGSLYKVDLSTGTATALTLPTGVTLSTTNKPQFAVLNQWVVLTNSPTRNLAIDPEGTVRVLVPWAPAHPPSVAAGSSTGLTGAYQFKTSFVVLNSDGDLLMESPLSPASDSITFANTDASLTDIALSMDEISARRIYRTLAGGTAYYHLLDHDGNTGTALINGTADDSVELLPALSDTLTAPPGTFPGIRFKCIVEWKSRLWAVADEPSLLDTIYISETNKIYAWPNTITAHPAGQDEKGIIALAPRRNQLGILKRNGVWQIAAASGGTGIATNQIQISQIGFDKAGCVAVDSVVSVNNKVYWLGNDGVYEWDDNGIKNISEESVAPWFKTATYFNRARFPNAFAKYNELRDQYELHLTPVGGSTETRWVAFNITTRKWYGPHLTDLFTPSHAGSAFDADGLPVTLVGGTNGVIYTANSTNYRDGASTAIDFDCYGPFHHMNAPDIEHQWLDLSMLTKVESAGTLTVTPYVGRLDASAGTAISHTLTTGRESLRRLGRGPMMRLRFRHNTVNQSVSIFGYEVPVFEMGKR